jgi:hypothetical protein
MRFFKVVGYATALLTLGFGLSRVWVAVADYRERQREVEELLATADVLMIGADYRDAWETVNEALELDDSPRVRERLEDVAMVWLRDASVPAGETFDSLVSPLLPVITRGITLSEGQRRADLLAHLGYAGFLRWKNTGTNTDFDRYYDEALGIDPANPFANAFSAHWILQPPSGSFDDAQAHFRVAIEGDREREFVRRMQLAALTNSSTLESDAAMVRMAVELHAANEPVPEGFVRELWSQVYVSVMANRNALVRDAALGAAPAEAHAAMFEAFFDAGSAAYRDSRWERDLWLATILEQAGEPARARTILEETLAVLASESPEINESYPELIREAIARLDAGRAR